MTQSVLITGASSGIGAATAEHLAACGWQVFGTSRQPRGRSEDGAIGFVQMDVNKDDSVSQAFEAILSQCGSIDAVVCNAGMGIFGSVEDVSLAAAKDQFETNYFGTLRVLKACLPHMRQAGTGRILLVGSLAGRAPLPFQSHYSSSKAAIDSLAGALRSEVAPFGIHVSLIEPGDVNTAFNDAMAWQAGEANPAYTSSLQLCEEKVRDFLPKSPSPILVAHCIERALTAKKPKIRYPVGDSSAWQIPLARRFFPETWLLALIRRTYGL